MPSPEVVSAELERIFASPEFARSQRMREFLRFTVEAALKGEVERIKEFAIAVEVFGRDESFDPQTNSLVRVEAGRLRRTLKQYYLTHGKNDPIRIEIPKGRYAPQFSMAGAAETGDSPSAEGPAARGPAPGDGAADGGRAGRPATAAARNGNGHSSRPPTILVVDDEPQIEAQISQKYRKRVREGSLSFLFARDGEEALDTLLTNANIDMILTDINMPRMDGLTLLDHLPEIDPILAAVVVTAYGDMPNIRTAMNRGAFDFITKPIDFDDLTSTIERSLAHLAIAREAAEEHDQLLSLRREISVARGIQNSLFPDTFPNDDRFAIYGQNKPASEFGSDFYDVFAIDEDRWAILIGEASGRGIRAALGMAVSRTAMKTAALSGLAARDCVARFNDLLCEQAGSEILASLFFGFYDAATGALAFVNAGHQPPYALRAGGRLETLPGEPDRAVGLQADAVYAEQETRLAPGDSLFLYTDGVPGAFDASQRQFSVGRLEEILGAAADLSPRDLAERVMASVDDFAGDAAQKDDLTCIALKRLG